MDKLLRISFDTVLTSLTPILGWFLLGILLNPNLINVFTLIYPMQFVVNTIKSIFGTGANISAIRDNNENSIYSGVLIGGILGGIILGITVINIDKYIIFMNMNVEIYKIFGIYGIIQLFLQLILYLALCKLYYEDNNKRANKYSLWFNLINFSSLIIMSILTKNQIVITSISIITTSIFVCIMLFRIVKRTKIKINIANCIKYDAVTLFDEVSMFVIYLFGFKTAFYFGDKYILATSFATLITDMQWDACNSVKTLAQINITKNNFSYKEHIKDSFKLINLLVVTTFIMGILLYPFYKTNLQITGIILGIEILSMYMYPIYITKLIYIQMEHSTYKATISKQIANVIRAICSFIPTPYCTSIGLAGAVIFQLIISKYIILKNNIFMEKREKLKT